MDFSLDQIPLAIFAKDLESRFIYANKVALDYWNCSLEELLGKNDRELWTGFGAQYAKKYMEDDKKVMETGVSLRGIRQPAVRRKGLEMMPAVANKSPLRDATGKIVGLIGVFMPLNK